MGLVLSSEAFDPGSAIPRRFTADGQDVSPPLAWSGAPGGTVSLALIMDDPDAPTPAPWVHWVLFGLSPDLMSLREGVSPKARLESPAGAHQGLNSWHSIGYRGPAPPKGHGVHRYHFRLFALDEAPTPGPSLDKGALLRAMQGHVLAQTELVGTYSR